MRLARSCQTLLEQAELKVTTLQEIFAGAVTPADADDYE
jgi:hypothetical protein